DLACPPTPRVAIRLGGRYHCSPPHFLFPNPSAAAHPTPARTAGTASNSITMPVASSALQILTAVNADRKPELPRTLCATRIGRRRLRHGLRPDRPAQP